MKFKVGDKVRIVHNSNGSDIVKKAMNKIGIIKSMNAAFDMVIVDFDKDIYFGLSVLGFFKDEIEKVSTKGQQLLLFDL